jgi:hypothetical protein
VHDFSFEHIGSHERPDAHFAVAVYAHRAAAEEVDGLPEPFEAARLAANLGYKRQCGR